jgi:hypothetical protein
MLTVLTQMPPAFVSGNSGAKFMVGALSWGAAL